MLCVWFVLGVDRRNSIELKEGAGGATLCLLDHLCVRRVVCVLQLQGWLL